MAITLVLVLVVTFAYMAIAYQSMINYALKQHPTVVYRPGSRFLLTKPKNGNPTVPPFRYIVIGDSTSLGQGASAQIENYSYQYAQSTLLQNYQAVQIYNLAVSGAKTGDILANQVETAIALAPDLIMLSVGANDVTNLVNVTDFRRNYAMILQQLSRSSAEIVLLNIPAFSTVPLFWEPYRFIADYRGRQFNQIIAEVAKAEPKVKLVDIYNGTEREFRLYPERNFSEDKFHPSSAGYAVWARVIAESLQ